MVYARKDWVGISLALAFSLAIVFVAMGGVARATSDIGSVHGILVAQVDQNAGSAVAVHKEKAAETATSTTEEERGHGLNLTHRQIWNFVWFCLNFACLVYILVRFGKKPVADALNGRIESIQNAFDDLDAKRSEAEGKYAEYERKLSGIDEQAKSILESFKEQGQAEKEKIIARAHDAAETIKAQAEFYVQQELANAKAELQSEVADMAVKMAEELIRKNLDEQDHHRLISEYLERVVQKN
ncbi:MAG: F0F1 ATP synthase subunit B [Nitrospiraceae bacterium]|nr:F0F1 ATP synthase subunit B [Nitrospiraceae bacterium]